MVENDELEEFELQGQDNIKCPYCGWEDTDSWEHSPDVNEGDLGIIICGECEKEFTTNRNMIITYDSKKAPCLNGESDHDWTPVVGLPKEYFKEEEIKNG